MRYARLVAARWPLVGTVGVAFGALALLGYVRAGPVQVWSLGRIDALSAFFACASFGGLALAGLVRPTALRSWRVVPIGLALALAYGSPFALGVAVGYAALALFAPSAPALPTKLAERRLSGLARTLARALAAISLLIGYGALALRGAPRYDDPAAAAALDSFAFWFVLLAATIAIADFGFSLFDWGNAGRAEIRSSESDLFGALRIAWLYPLARLYSLGQWNAGWSLAAVLFGGAVTAGYALSALTEQRAGARRARTSSSVAGLALAGVGLGSSAGMAAACFAILVHALLNAANSFGDRSPAIGDEQAQSPIARLQSSAAWALTTAFPFTAPFVAAWMSIGAGLAGGVALLAGVVWLAALAHGLAAALWEPPGAGAPRRALLALAAISVGLGVGAPLVVLWLIRPVVEQLQGGLTPYGEANIWPWVGLAASDAAHTQVTALPSIAVALLMLVLCALVYVIARLRAVASPAAPDASHTEAGGSAADSAADAQLMRLLRAEVPWLALFHRAGRQPERPRGDRE